MAPLINTLLPAIVALSLGLAAWANPEASFPRARPAAAAASAPAARPLFVETLTVVAPRASAGARD